MAKGKEIATGNSAGDQDTGPLVATDNQWMLTGIGDLADGQQHVAVGISMKASGDPSTLIIEDVAGIKKGKPIYITAPIRIKGANVAAFLEAKGIDTKSFKKFLDTAEIGMDAFYFAKGQDPDPDTLLAIVDLKTDGLLGTLISDDPKEQEAFNNLFNLTGAAVRVAKAPASAAKQLEDYLKSVVG